MRTRVLACPLLILPLACAVPRHPLAIDSSFAEEAIGEYVSRGRDAVPELRDALGSDDARVRSHAKTALGRITGQWGSEGDGIYWKRSVSEALNDDRPLLVLHLFGKLDEEFC